ncbi:MAG: FAD-dependent oxidoreductase [Thermoplasmata archaeon]
MEQRKKILVVGGGAAALSAVMNARKESRSAQIAMFSEERVLPYSRCGLPFILDGEISEPKNLITQKENFFKMINVNPRLRSKVREIDISAKRITYIDENQKENSESYDTLILCTGAKPAIPRMPGIDKAGVFALRTLDDAINISMNIKHSKRAVIVGAGLIGLETAYTLKKAGVSVWVVELQDSILKPMLDPDMAKLVQERIEKHGIKIHLGKKVESIEGEEKVSKVIVENQDVPCEIVIFATGVKPNSELAQKSGIKVGEFGGITVNERMETSAESVYAAGDCVETVHKVSGKNVLSQLGTTAVRQGKVAGINATGGNAVYKGTLNASVTRIFDIEVGSVGLTEWQAKALGIEVVSIAVPWKTRAEYFPGTGEMKIKLVFRKEDSQIIGGQIVTKEGALGYVNLLSLAIDKGVKPWDLLHMDTCYSPPVADIWNPVCIAAELVLKKGW